MTITPPDDPEERPGPSREPAPDLPDPAFPDVLPGGDPGPDAPPDPDPATDDASPST